MDIGQIFDEVANQMRSDIEKARSALKHPGLKGEAFEETFRTFLRNYLPRSLDVSTGILVDAHGASTRQLDAIVSDTARTPIFYASGQVRVIPVECAYAVIEVKAKLDTGELERVFENMGSVRSLQKTAFYKYEGPIVHSQFMYGTSWDIWPINYYVFAYDSVDLKTVADYIQQYHKSKDLPVHQRIDTVCVLDKGVVCNQDAAGNLDALPEPHSSLGFRRTSRSLLLFYALTSRYFNHATLPNFRFTDYIKKIKF